MHYVFVLIMLYLFWIVLSGYFTPLLLGLGGLSVLLAGWLLHRMDRADGQLGALRPSIGLFGYGLWLMWSVVKANIDVVRRIWSPSLPINPVWERLDTRVSTPAEKALYANSITLTPGTLTTDVNEDHFVIHSLSPEGLSELGAGEMERRIRRLGI